MIEKFFTNVSESEKNAAIEGIIKHAAPRHDFFLMLVLSVAMASFGVLLNSVVILVASMLIAPLLFPLLSLALGIVIADDKLIGRSVYTLFKSIMFALAAGVIIGLLFSAHQGPIATLGIEGVPFSPIYVIVAAIAGLAAAFAMTKPDLNETLPGVAISVSLVPPLAAAGVAISSLDWALFSGAIMLFIVNVIGIVFSSMIVFSLFKFAAKKAVATEAVREEDKLIRREERKPSAIKEA